MSHVIRINGTLEYEQDYNDTILHSALRNGLGFPYECSAGSCGTCRFELLEGEVHVAWPDAPAWSERDRKKGRYLGCQTSARSGCSIRVALSTPGSAPISLSRSHAQLVAKRTLTHDMMAFTFQTDAPAVFLPGQFALVSREQSGPTRSYSMANLPNDDGLWQFIVRRIPGGTLSTTLFEARIGDRYILDAPLGMAYFRETAPEDIVCIAGGSGISMALSVARSAAAIGRRVNFFYGGRRPADMACLTEIQELIGSYSALRVYSAISAPMEEDYCWEGQRGLLPDIVRNVLGNELPRYRFYAAGAPPMIAAVQTLLGASGVPAERVHFDRFV